ncbi:MAG: GIDE domain-containing protein [Candidatus Eisenbacteria bacterium]
MNPAMSLFATLGVLFGPWMFLHGFRAWRIHRLIEDTPTARIRSMAMGLVELSGHIEHRSRMSAPFSGRECAYWELDISTFAAGRSGEHQWRVVHQANSGNPFYLRDCTGVALVYPQGAELRTSPAVEEKTGGMGVPQMYMDYMQAHELGMRHVWAIGGMRFRERILEDGAGAYVLGRANPKAMSQSISDEGELEEVLEATGTDAWVARRLRDTDREVAAVVRRAQGDPVFLISPTTERFMTMEYGFKAFGGLLGGPAVTLFSIWCVLELIKSHEYFIR